MEPIHVILRAARLQRLEPRAVEVGEVFPELARLVDGGAWVCRHDVCFSIGFQGTANERDSGSNVSCFLLSSFLSTVVVQAHTFLHARTRTKSVQNIRITSAHPKKSVYNTIIPIPNQRRQHLYVQHQKKTRIAEEGRKCGRSDVHGRHPARGTKMAGYLFGRAPAG